MRSTRRPPGAAGSGLRRARRQRHAAGSPPSEWIGGRAPAPAWVTGEGAPYRPDVLLWLDRDSGLILGTDMVAPDAPLGVLADCLDRALAGPAGADGPPAVLRVADAAAAADLRARLGAGIEVRVAPTPEIDDVMRHMRATMQTEPAADGYLEKGRVDAAAVGRMFVAAARLWRAAPWDYLWDADLLLAEVPALGASRCVSVLGRLGESFGLVLFEDVAAYDAFASRGEEAARGRRRESDSLDLGTTLLSLNFDKRAALSKRMLREIKIHGWKVAPGAYPHIQWMDPDGMLRPLTADLYRLVSAVATAVAVFIERHAEGLADAAFGGASEEVVVDDGDAPVTVRVTAPHPEAPWVADAGNAAPEADDEEEMEEDRSAAHEAAERRVADFVAAGRARGRDQAWCRTAELACRSLYDFTIDYEGGTVAGLAPGAVEEFCLDYFPRKVMAADDDIDAVPERLIEHFAWLAETGRLEPAEADQLSRRVQALRNRFVRAARDPRRHGPAKALLMDMVAAGVDLSDERAVARHVDRLNREGGVAPQWSPADPPALDRAARPSRPRWAPKPGQAPPAPTDPCPCGSGKRYKKCCLRR